MQAVVVRAFGEPDVLKLEDIAVPEPGAGEVRVRVHASGVNPVDTYVRAGKYGASRTVPYTPGSDASGVIDAVGADVSGFSVGDRVYTSATRTGAYAEFTVASASTTHRLPDNVSFAAAAGINVPYATAYRSLLQRARALPGETVLVHGASGGVGTAATQVCRWLGFPVTGTAGSEKGRELVLSEGADAVYDHTEDGYLTRAVSEMTGGRGFDIVLEMLANVNLEKDIDALAPGGRIVVIGSRGRVEIDPRGLMMRDAQVMGMLLFNAPPDELARVHTALFAGLKSGALRPVVGKELPLSQASLSHVEILEPGAYGKIVLVPGG